jgi:hypothetical protein
MVDVGSQLDILSNMVELVIIGFGVELEVSSGELKVLDGFLTEGTTGCTVALIKHRIHYRLDQPLPGAGLGGILGYLVDL